MRDRKISKKEYVALVKELRAEVKRLGFRLRIRYKLQNISAYGDWYKPHANGYCNTDEKRLEVKVYGRPARREILAVIAHEVRHAFHFRNGMFADYYNTRQDVGTPAYEPYDELVAWKAEMDCDNWSDFWLRSKNIRQTDHMYHRDSTLAHHVNQDHKFRLDHTIRTTLTKKAA